MAALVLAVLVAVGNQWGLVTPHKLELIGYSPEMAEEIGLSSERFFSERASKPISSNRLFGQAGNENDLRRLRRFILYTHHPDEHYVLLGLARMNPSKLDFNPHSMEYGNALLLPAGVVLKLAQWAGILKRGNVAFYIRHPMEFRRIFVILRLFIFAVFVLTLLLGIFGGEKVFREKSGAWLGGFLFALSLPSVNCWFHFFKPHGYMILFSTLSVLAVEKSLRVGGTKTAARYACLSFAAAGAAAAASVYALLLFAFPLFVFWKRRPYLEVLHGLACGVIVFLLFNHYYITDFWETIYHFKRQFLWYGFDATGKTTANNGSRDFLLATRAVIHSIGPLSTILIAAAILFGLWRPGKPRAVALATLFYFVAISVLVSRRLYHWYEAKYLLATTPWIALLVTEMLWSCRGKKIASAAFAFLLFYNFLGCLQITVNFWNDTGDRTLRCAAGEWINENLPSGATVFIDRTIAPFNSPFFDIRRVKVLDRFDRNNPPDYYVWMEYGPHLVPNELIKMGILKEYRTVASYFRKPFFRYYPSPPAPRIVVFERKERSASSPG